MQIPNIFDYATSELSQDAFICWLIKLADIEGHELQTASKEFIALLCRIGSDDKEVKASDIGKLINMNPKKQYPLQQYGAPKYGKMDVFFIAEVNNKATCFIIEDKVHSDPHSDQLKKYVEFVKIKHPDLPIVKVYFKTGYLFDNEILKCQGKEPGYNYGIIDYRAINSYLLSVETQDVIFSSYRNYIQRKFFNRYEEGLKAMKEKDGHLLLKNDFIQYEFLKLLSNICPETVGTKSFSTGVSTGGVPYAHYRFIWLKDAFGKDKHERIWYRIELRKNKIIGKYCFCLSLRQYSENLDEQQKMKKLEQLKKYKEVFKEISGKSADIVFAKPHVDHIGSNSSEIGLLFFDDKKNSIQSVIENLPIIHKEFVSKYQQVNNEYFKN